jgi:hypothetical protein
MRVEGRCHCGDITYEAEIDPAKVGICYCTDCQTLSSSAFATFVPVPKEAFRLRTGKPKTYVKTAESGARWAQVFCPECGTRIYAAAASDPQIFSVRVGTLRQRAELPPRAQLWCRSALPWVMDLGSIRQLSTQRPM